MRGDAEAVLCDPSVRGDIIKTMHCALTRDGGRFDPSALALHDEVPSDPVTCRLVDRGLDDVLAGNRSEEHTSDIQTLMRISYAALCLQTTISLKQHTKTITT